MKFPLSRALLLLACLLSTACSLQTALPEKTFYQFGASRPSELAPASQRQGLLRVQEFRAAQINRTSSLIYRETDQRFVADPYRQFTATPASLITERTRHWLAASGRFAAVAPAGSSLLAPDLTLEGELVEFYADVRQPHAPAVVVTLRAWLVGKDDRLVRPEWRFSRRVALAAPDAATVAAGFDQALTEALADLEKALGQ